MKKSNSPFVLGICTTYKRPRALQNALQCFLDQSYPHRWLHVLDDAGMYTEHGGDNWSITSLKNRIPSLPDKHHEAIQLGLRSIPRHLVGNRRIIIALWDDDDIYLHNHMAEIAKAFQEEADPKQYFAPDSVYSNYGCPFGEVVEENAIGRFHGSWAFTLEAYTFTNGYDQPHVCNFDALMGDKLHRVCGRTFYSVNRPPTYVYRWGSNGYNVSSQGNDGWGRMWEHLGRVPAEWQGDLTPKYDEETLQVFDFLGGCRQ